jgi:hypothetical protein
VFMPEIGWTKGSGLPVMQKKKPCAGGSAGFHLSTGNFRAVAFPSSVGSRSDQLDNTAAEF